MLAFVVMIMPQINQYAISIEEAHMLIMTNLSKLIHSGNIRKALQSVLKMANVN